MERETGIEPATNSLEGCDSTTELLPPPCSLLTLSRTTAGKPAKLFVLVYFNALVKSDNTTWLAPLTRGGLACQPKLDAPCDQPTAARSASYGGHPSPAFECEGWLATRSSRSAVSAASEGWWAGEDLNLRSPLGGRFTVCCD
jgi:hypothetical protein